MVVSLWIAPNAARVVRVTGTAATTAIVERWIWYGLLCRTRKLSKSAERRREHKGSSRRLHAIPVAEPWASVFAWLIYQSQACS